MVEEKRTIFQIITIGVSVKVIAVDEATGTEITLIVPKGTPIPSLKAAAQRKLEYVMNKNKQSA